MKLKPASRKKAEELILKWVSLIDPSRINTALLKKNMPKLSDDEFIQMCDNGIPLYQPLEGKTKISTTNNLAVAKQMGIPLEEHLWLPEPKTGILSRTIYPHMVLMLPWRRQTQMVDKKLSVAKNDRIRDKITGQVTGPSKSSGISFQEGYVMFSQGETIPLREFIHARGSNEKINRALYQSIRTTGRGRMDIPGAELTSSKTSKTWGHIYRSMHIGNNIGRPTARNLGYGQ